MLDYVLVCLGACLSLCASSFVHSFLCSFVRPLSSFAYRFVGLFATLSVCLLVDVFVCVRAC